MDPIMMVYLKWGTPGLVFVLIIVNTVQSLLLNQGLKAIKGLEIKVAELDKSITILETKADVGKS